MISIDDGIELKYSSKGDANDGVVKITDIIAGYTDFSRADRVIEFDKIVPAIKWKKYFNNTENIEFIHLVSYSSNLL